MAASSFSSPRTWTYRVFTSFHGPDVRKVFLSHLRKQFSFNGISIFDDQGIERGETIAPALSLAIRESRISIVVLSTEYASSIWCLDELVEIFKCKKDLGQIVMTVFYGVDPSDVQKQTGEFGRAFNETCARKTEEERQKWGQALTNAGNIAGEDSLNWDNEAKMIEKIAKDVLDKLNATTPSKDFDGMVGIEAHLREIESLLDLDYDGVKMVAIFGHAGIGKTTIARALYNRLSSSFQLACFMENLKGSCHIGLDEYGLKLRLQENLLSKILGQNGMRINHLGAIPEMLCDQKVLIILDDVDDMKQLEALVDETNWFGPRSRIIVTTEDQELLEKHDINNTYHVDFPTKQEARKILCRYAFRRSLPPYGFEKLVERVIDLCSNLPLGLRVIGSTLRGKNEDDWEGLLRRQENSLDQDIKGVLRVGYENLHKDDQLLFLLIAFFFNYKGDEHVKTILADSNLDVNLGLKTLAYRSLIQKSTEGKIVIHKLLQQVGREDVQRQDPRKRQILIDSDEICDVLENDSGNGSVMGISLNMSTLSSDVYISPGAFKRIRNLRYLNIYKTSFDKDYTVHIPDDMNFQSRLRLLHWEEYPGKCLPPTFRPEYLVELNLQSNKLEKLWEGIQPLTNLKTMNLEHSKNLKELPDLSNATNLEKLELHFCFSLVEIPSTIGNLQKLEHLGMQFCVNLQVVSTHLNLASLERVDMFGCCQLKKIPEIFRNIRQLLITDTMLQYLPESIRLSSRLQILYIVGSGVQTLSIFGNNQIEIDWIKDELDRASYIKDVDVVDIEKLPDWIKDLDGLEGLYITGCPRLASLPELPASLKSLGVNNCESLETLMPFPSESAIENLCFINCLKLGQEARRVITQQSNSNTWLPGRNAPEEFHHRAIGNSLIIPTGTEEFRYCVVVSPRQKKRESSFRGLWRLSCNGVPSLEITLEFTYCVMVSPKKGLFWSLIFNGVPNEEITLLPGHPQLEMDHLLISHFILPGKLKSDALFEFISISKDLDVIECGIQNLTEKTNSSYKSIPEQESLFDGINEFDEPRVKRLKTEEASQSGTNAAGANTKELDLKDLDRGLGLSV